jgi:hypothetical protein
MVEFFKHPNQTLGPFILMVNFVKHLDQTFGPFPNTSCFECPYQTLEEESLID